MAFIPRLHLSYLALMFLSACGGGGGGSSAGNSVASIAGTSTGSVSSTSSEASGVLTVTDPDPGQATFVQPTNLTGAYGTWSVVLSGAQATWRYNLNTSQAPAVTSTETLTVRSLDGSASQAITVSIAGSANSSSALVTSVPDPVYSGAYASEKVAVFNRLNSDRARCGFGKLAQNSKLDTAAQNHANYLALNPSESGHTEIQGNPGYTGYRAGERINYAGYQYSYGGEDIGFSLWGTWFSSNTDYSATELSATNALLGLYGTVYHLASLMDRTTEVGIGLVNAVGSPTSNSKTLVTNAAIPSGNTTGQLQATDAITTFPCDGSAGLFPAFKGEDPDPFPSVNRDLTPYGQPVFVQSGRNTTLTLTAGTITLRGGSAVPTTILTSANDPQAKLLNNQVFLVPTTRLANNSTYDVVLSGTNSGMVSTSNPTGAWSRTFSFSTGTMISE